MYNNLDASLDTTAFTQYTQSQEESMYVYLDLSLPCDLLLRQSFRFLNNEIIYFRDKLQTDGKAEDPAKDSNTEVIANSLNDKDQKNKH